MKIDFRHTENDCYKGKQRIQITAVFESERFDVSGN